MKNPWKTLSSAYVHENPWWKVRHDAVVRPDGKPGEYFVLDSRGGAQVIALDQYQHVLLVRQFRYTTAIASWELPCGGLDEGEAPLTAAKRELLEEAGARAKSWKKLGTLQEANGMSNARTHVFLATGLKHFAQNDQAAEGIVEMKAFSAGEIISMICTGKITDSQALAGLLLYIALETKARN